MQFHPSIEKCDGWLIAFPQFAREVTWCTSLKTASHCTLFEVRAWEVEITPQTVLVEGFDSNRTNVYRRISIGSIPMTFHLFVAVSWFHGFILSLLRLRISPFAWIPGILRTLILVSHNTHVL